MASAGIACGLEIDNLGFIYFDAHDDMDTPSTNENGYFDAMGLSMLAGKSWHWHTEQIPGYAPMKYDKRFLYVGLRDVNDTQRKTVADAGADIIWGDADKHRSVLLGSARRCTVSVSSDKWPSGLYCSLTHASCIGRPSPYLSIRLCDYLRANKSMHRTQRNSISRLMSWLGGKL